MYKKSVQGWLKHLDFMILDVVCLWISFTLAFNMRHGSLDVLANSLYRDMMWSLALMDIVVIFFFDSLKNVLKRGFYQEFVMTVKQTCLITLCSVFYLFTFKEAENYSRLVLGYTAALYLLISYVLRCLWKNCLRKYFGGAEKRSLLIVTVSDIVDTVIDNIKNKNYGDYFVTGVCILDKKAKGRVIDGVTVVADEDDLVEYVCREWVDEVFINIPESEPYPAELLDKFIEMGVVVHMKLAKSQNLLGKKQFVEHLGTYTVLTTSINSVSRRQIILKRMMDIAGGLAGCIITGILCIFVGPAIYIQSPGPIFFKQTRVGKNGKLFQMYKFRSMYMDAEERKAELMKENRVQDGMMFKLDFDPRIIGSKKLPDGTIKKGVGNFIRDWSLDEFPQFFNVLKGDMSLVGTRPPTVDEWDKYELHHRARLATKPGLTGMWQVSGRSNITDLEKFFKAVGIKSILAGVDTNRDTFRVNNCVTCANVYRAKGNEAPMVYIVNSEYCADGAELSKLRNILFTSITRSRAWVRICGVGEEMQQIQREYEQCADNDYNLCFKVPTPKELEAARKLNRERTSTEKKILKTSKDNINELIDNLENGTVDLELLPELDKLMEVLKKGNRDEKD